MARKPETVDQMPRSIATSVNDYRGRGLFRSVEQTAATKQTESFRLLWRYDRPVQVRANYRSKTITMEGVLPGIDAGSPMFAELRTFMLRFHHEDTLVHRRVDPALGAVTATIGRDGAAVTIAVKNDQYDEGFRKLVHVVNELYFDFLADGPYLEYQAEHLGLDLDRV